MRNYTRKITMPYTSSGSFNEVMDDFIYTMGQIDMEVEVVEYSVEGKISVLVTNKPKIEMRPENDLEALLRGSSIY